MLAAVSVGAVRALSSGTAAGADLFYTTRLHAGQDALRARRFAEAADELRIACFGLLDEPQALLGGLVLLSLAQTGAGRTGEVEVTIQRFTEVERGFPGYATLALDPSSKVEFEALLTKRLAPEILLSIPSLARLVETPQQKLAKLPPRERKGALEALAAREPRNPEWPLQLARLAASEANPKAVIALTGKALELDAASAEARELRGQAYLQRRDYKLAIADLSSLPPSRFAEQPGLQADLFVATAAEKSWDAARSLLEGLPAPLRSRPDVAAAVSRIPTPTRTPAPAAPPQPTPSPTPASAASPAPTAVARLVPTPAPTGPPPAGRPLNDLLEESRRLGSEGKAAEALRLLMGSAAAHGQSREFRKALLEASTLAKDFRSAATQARALEPFPDGEEAMMFYAAVAFHETGSPESARALLTRARPKIASSPFVEYYARRIQGLP